MSRRSGRVAADRDSLIAAFAAGEREAPARPQPFPRQRLQQGVVGSVLGRGAVTDTFTEGEVAHNPVDALGRGAASGTPRPAPRGRRGER